MKVNYTLTLGFYALSLMSTNSIAQVTIGSNKLPLKGVLLELDSQTKGLGLPRVQLIHPNKLQPMYTYESDNTPSTQTEQAHAGLIVYNVETQFCFEKPIKTGISVWTGEKWKNIGNDKSPFMVDKLVDDRDPANPVTYEIGYFNRIGWVMLENLRADRWPDGTTTTNGVIERETDMSNKSTEPRFMPLFNEDKYLTEHPEYGYFYNGAAMLWNDPRGSNESSDLRRQGICPNGWYVPDNLSLYGIPTSCKYSIPRENGKPNVKSMTKLDPTSEFPDIKDTNGSSRPSSDGGFDLLLLGYKSSFYDRWVAYGEEANTWTSTTSLNDGKACGTVALSVRKYDHVQLSFSLPNDLNFYPIRCIKYDD